MLTDNTQIPQFVQPAVTGSSGLFISNEDNMLLMSRYPDNYFDLAIVDPPYGIDLANMNMGAGSKPKHCNKKRRGFDAKDWDLNPPTKEYFNELFRVSKNQIIWGGNYFELGTCYGFCIWDKGSPEGMSFSDCEFAWHSFKKVAKLFKYSTYLDKGNKIHPTQKPIQLYKWIIKTYAKEGDKIIDTHLGSGSHAIAVEEMNRFEKMNLTLTACEIDKQYFTDTTTRINNHVAQQSLF